MRGLFLHLSPFAPDQSGVVSALYEMGGLLVVCDAGGCTGNICGFDEPRWKTHSCALFSAGLRDMDAILGRDDRLVDRTVKAAGDLRPAFVAYIGTPVPCVIGTDFFGIRRMTEKRLAATHADCPVLTFDTTGTATYEKGSEQAYLSLCRTFTNANEKKEAGSLGVFGATPLDVGPDGSLLADALRNETACEKVVLHGFGSGLDAIRHAAGFERNLVVAPSGLAAARYLAEERGIPFSIGYPMTPQLSEALDRIRQMKACRILIVHQHVLATALRERILKENPEASVTCASFFTLLPGTEGVFLADEDAFIHCVENGSFDCIVGDAVLARAVPDAQCLWIDIPHFAISGRG